MNPSEPVIVRGFLNFKISIYLYELNLPTDNISSSLSNEYPILDSSTFNKKNYHFVLFQDIVFHILIH